MRSGWKGSAEENEAIERVLAGLRGVQAPEGMERRVLERVREAGEARVTGEDGASGRGSGFMPVGILAAAVLLLLAWGGGVRWLGMNGPGAAPARQTVGPRNLDQSTVRGGTALARLPVAGSPPTERRSATERGELAGRESRRGERRGAAGLTVEEEARREDGVAAAEMLAPSRVAMPLPLTKQERLLQRAAQRGGADEMAALTEAERVKQGEASKAEFRAFFGPARSEAGELEEREQGEGDARN